MLHNMYICFWNTNVINGIYVVWYNKHLYFKFLHLHCKWFRNCCLYKVLFTKRIFFYFTITNLQTLLYIYRFVTRSHITTLHQRHEITCIPKIGVTFFFCHSKLQRIFTTVSYILKIKIFLLQNWLHCGVQTVLRETQEIALCQYNYHNVALVLVESQVVSHPYTPHHWSLWRLWCSYGSLYSFVARKPPPPGPRIPLSGPEPTGRT